MRPAPAPTRALVVDDSRTEQRLAVVALRAAGCEVSSVGSALEALIALGEAPYAFVLLDQQLPDLPGASLVALVHREFLDPPPMAMWSAEGSIEASALAAGAVAFLSKPVPPATLGILARQHLRPPAGMSHQPLLDDRQLRDSVLVPTSADEGRIFVGRWQAEIASLLEEAVGAARKGLPTESRSAVHRLLGCAALTGARRLQELASALHARPERLCEAGVVQEALDTTQASARALLLRATLLGRD